MADLTKRPSAPRRQPPAPVTATVPSVWPGRYSQLTYTSFDAGASAPRGSLHTATGQRSHGGGWQVKQVVGDLDPAEIEHLTARIVTRFDLEPALPAFPTPDQIAHRPARLSYVAFGDGRAAYWHTVDAGRDGTGRPGNVFAHVIAVEEQDGAVGGFAPIELWHWPGWLIPYGQEAVTAATLPDGPPALVANQALSVESSVAFLLDAAGDRTVVARVLLDAVAARLADPTNGPVVLAVDDHDRAASWIAAVSHFLTPAGARNLSWSTHDSADAVAAGVAADLHLVVVPRAGATGLLGHTGVGAVIDETEEPYLGDPGSVHRLPAAAAGTVAVTPLSVLAEAVLADEEIALRVLSRRDAVAAAFEAVDGAALVPEWPIAVAVLDDPELAEFHRDAAAVVVDEAPQDLTAVPWAAALVEGTLRAHPPTPDEAVARLGGAARRGRGTGLLAQYVLAAALRDPGWLDRCDLAAVPAVATARLGALPDDVLAHLSAPDAGFPDRTAATRAVLRCAELVERLATDDADLDTARTALAGALTRVGLDLVGEPGWAEALDAGQVSEAVLARYLRPEFVRRSPEELDGLRADVSLWLYGTVADGVRFARPEPGTDVDDYLFAFAAQAVLRDPELGIPVEARAHYAGEAIRGALRCDRLDDAQCRALVDGIVTLARPSAADLLEFSAATDRVPPKILDSLVFYGDVEDAALTAILDAPDAATPELVAAAWLRLARRHGGTTDRQQWCDSVHTLAGSASSVPQPGSTVTWVTQAADDLVVMTATGFILAQSDGASWADPTSGFCASLNGRMAGGPNVQGLYAQVVDELARAEAAWVLDTAWVAGHAFTVARRLSGAGGGPLEGLGSPSVREPGRLVPWSQWLIEQRIAAGDYRGPADVDGLRDAAWRVVCGLDADTAEQFFTGLREAAGSWLVQVGIRRPAGPASFGHGGLGGLG
jgi:hypothetical protein